MNVAQCLPSMPRLSGNWALELPLAGKAAPFEECDRPEAFEPVGGTGADRLALSGAERTLFRGSSGQAVRNLQARLRDAGFDPGAIDGDFGHRTKAAVMRFQRANRLTVDGIAGASTWGALLGETPATPAPAPRAHAPAARPSGPALDTPHGPMVRRGSEYISARIAPMYDAMKAAAARDGVTLEIKDGYRSHREQVILWNRFGRNRKRVARPGHSNHQTGTAIDFADTPGAWRWLKRNASKFGLHNYKPEPWHYSLTGR